MKTKVKIQAFGMLFLREVSRFYKVIVQTVFTPVITSSLYLLIFGLSLGKNIQMEGDISYLLFLIPGLMMMSCLNNAFQNTSSSIVSSKFTGELQDYRVTPLSFQQIIWAFSFAGLFRGLLVCFITYLIGESFYYFQEGSFFPIHSPFFLVSFLVLGGLSFSMLGICVSIIVKTFDQLTAMGTFIITPLIYLGGVFFSIKDLHPFWQTLSKLNPLLYWINGVRFGVLGITDVSIGFSLGICLISLIIFCLLAQFSLKRGSYSRW